MFNVDAETGELWIYDEIGPSWWGMIDAGAVMDGLKAIGDKPATVRINTPGGSVDEGIAIFNALRAHKPGVTTIVDSLAASMGSYIMQAGATRLVHSNAAVMVHDPWTIAMGNSAELRKVADITDKYAARMMPDYAARSGKTTEEIQSIMAAETWYAGHEIVDAGFADSIVTGESVAPMTAGLHKIAKNIPQNLMDSVQLRAGELHKFPLRQAARRPLTVAEAKKLLASIRE